MAGAANTKISVSLVLSTAVRGEAFGDVVKQLNRMNTGIEQGGSKSIYTRKKLQDMLQTLGGIKKGSNQFNKLMADPRVQESIKRLNSLYKRLKTNIEGASKELKGSAFQIPLTEGQINKEINNLQSLLDEVGEGGEKFEALNSIIQNFATQGLSKLGGGFSKAAMAGGTLSTAATGVGVALVIFGGLIKFTTKRLKFAVKQIKDFNHSIERLWGGLKNAVSGFRLMSQGFLSIARSMTFFVSAPLVAFIKGGATAALGLEEALIRVAKVTGDLFDDISDMNKYTDAILELSAVSVSSAEELAGFSEQLGQMGVRDADAMYELVAIMDVVANATDMAQDTIARDLGAISNAFGYSMADTDGIQNAINFIDRTAEVINALENAAGTTGGEVVEMLKDVGSVFAGLTTDVNEAGEAFEMNVAQVAGWVTIAKEMGMTADEVGTAMRNMPSYVLDNADAIDKFGIANEMFANSQEFVNSLHKDFYNTMDALITTLADGDEALQNVAFSTDLLGRRSGRLIQNLIKAKKAQGELGAEFVRYDDIMAEALKAWEEGGSLMDEYTKMTESVNVQLKLLKNNFQNLGVTVGKDILPRLNGLVKVAQAGTLAFSNMFKSLTEGTKKTIGKVIAFVALYGPVSWFLSQTVFGISMVLNGMMRLGSFIGPLIGIFKKLVFGILTFNPVLILIAGTLYTLFSQYTGGVQSIVDKTSKVFKDLVDMTGKSAKTMMDTFAGGIIAGSKVVIAAVSAVASTIASFLEAHSPPEQGPLSSIDMWGSVLMNTYLKGFAKADFGILSDVAGTIEGILGSIHFTPTGDDDEQERKKVVKDLIKFREQFTKLLKDYRSGVKISEDYINNLVEGYGSSADEVKKLIEAHIALERVQRRLAEIEQERSDINRNYEEQVEVIRLSGKSAEEMVESVASVAYERDQSLGALSEEERLLKRREEMFEAQLELQQELMAALQEQSDLWKELLAFSTGGGGGRAESAIGSGGIADPTILDDVQSKAKEAQSKFIDLWIAAEKFRVVLMTVVEYAKDLWRILLGQDLPEESITERILGKFDVDAYGAEIINKWKNIFGEIETEADVTAFFKEYGEQISSGLGEMMSGADAAGVISDWVKDILPNAADALSKELVDGKLIAPEMDFAPVVNIPEIGDTSYLQTFLAQFEEDVKPLSDMAAGFLESNIVEGFTSFFGAISDGFNSIPAEAGQEENKLQLLGRNIGEIAAVLAEHMPGLADSLGNLAVKMMEFISAFLGIKDAEGVVEIFSGILDAAGKAIDKLALLFENLTIIFDYLRNPPSVNIPSVISGIPDEYQGIGYRMGGSQATSRYPQNQGGGWVMGGQIFKGAEAGGELFSAPTRGKITSHSLTTKMMHDLGGAGAGGTVINIDSPTIRDEQDINQLVDTIMYRIAQEI